MITDTNTDDLVALPGLVRTLRLPWKWLRDEATAGRIPSLKVGRKRLFSVQAVRATLATRAARGAVGIDTTCPPIPREGVQHG